MAAWLVAQVVTGEQQDDAVLAAAYQRLRHLTIEPPTPERMERIVHSALHTHETTLQRHVLAALSPVPLGPAEMDEKSSVYTPRPIHNEADRRVPCRTEGLIGPK